MGDKIVDDEPRCWIGVTSQGHVRAGVEGGFARLGHGKQSAVSSLCKGDWIACYCPRERMSKGEPVQTFTAIGHVVSDGAHESDMVVPEYRAWRWT